MTDDSHLYDLVTEHLARWQRRRLWADALLWLPRGLLAGLMAAAAIAALARFRPLLHNREVALIALAMALIGLMISLLALLLRKPALLEQARFFDGLFDLQERASTAVEVRTGRISVAQALAGHQLADTAAVVTQVDARSRLPLRPRWWDLLLVFAATTLLILAVILPNDQSAVLAERQAVNEAIAEEIVRLQTVEDRIQDDPLLDGTSREELLEPVRRALNELNEGRLSREEAVAVLSETEADLRELAQPGNTQAIAQTLQTAGQTLAEASSSAMMGQAMAIGDLARAASAANQLAENLAQMSTSERESLAQGLVEAAAALAEVDPTLAADLVESGRAMQGGDLERAQQALQEAAATLQQRGLEQAEAAQALAAADEMQAARGEVASAGLPSESATASGGSQSNQDGPGQGQSAQDGGGGQGANAAAGDDSQDGQGTGGPGPGGGHAETVFVPDYVDLGEDGGIDIQLSAECAANPTNCGELISESPTDFTDEQSLVPYEQVFGDYREAAFEALEGDYVPLGMKGLVRDYFSSLEP